jgi:glycosyltransferase involved in cell wall biosynthesis
MKIFMVETGYMENVAKVCGHHYARLFSTSSRNQVLYVSAPVSPFHLLNVRKFRHILNRFSFWWHGGKRYGTNLLAYVPMTLLPIRDTMFFNSSWVAERSLNFTFPPLERFLRKHDFLRADVLIFNNLLLHRLFHLVEAPVKMYRVEDDLEGFGNIPHVLLEIDKELIRQADVVLTSAHRLTEMTARLRPADVYYLPNAADFEHFQVQRVRMPREYVDIPAPRVIYVGMIDFWFDVPLLRVVASRLNRFSFVVIGPSTINLRPLQGVHNIFILGPRNYQDLPVYLHHADVGIIPFKRLPLIEAVNPIKLYEYMAAGLPVVSTAWDEMLRLGSPALITSSADEFASAIEEAHRNRDELRERSIAFAREHTWEKNVQKLYDLIQTYSAKKKDNSRPAHRVAPT